MEMTFRSNEKVRMILAAVHLRLNGEKGGYLEKTRENGYEHHGVNPSFNMQSFI